ncbi:MAG TPA: tetratricopeptide repeat protein [Candidatus Aminicenantes bacterium]|nr:tetratricopeptide repeat protein [Candidatus Aminicenantes bacterium]
MKRHTVIVAAFLLLAFAFALGAAPAGDPQKLSKKGEKLMAKFHKAIQQKKADEALDLIQQVIAMDPGYATAYHNRGVLLHQKGQVDEAVASFEKALQLQPDYANAQNALRQSLFEAGKTALAAQDFAKSNGYLLKLKDLPSPGADNQGMPAFTRFYLGYNFYNLKQYPQAEENFAACLALPGLETGSPDLFANATYFMGMISFVKKDHARSVEHFQKYLQLFAGKEQKPEFYPFASFFVGNNLFRILEAEMAKGQVAGMEAKVAEIIPYLEKAIADKIPSEDAHVLLGNCFVYAKNYDQAIATYQQLIAAYPQSPELASYKSFLEQLQKMQQQEQKAKKKR